MALRRAYAERCAYVDALMKRASRTTAAEYHRRDDAAANHDGSISISGCATMTSPSSAVNVDHCSVPMSIIKTRCLLTDQQLVQPTTQVQAEHFVIHFPNKLQFLCRQF